LLGYIENMSVPFNQVCLHCTVFCLACLHVSSVGKLQSTRGNFLPPQIAFRHFFFGFWRYLRHGASVVLSQCKSSRPMCHWQTKLTRWTGGCAGYVCLPILPCWLHKVMPFSKQPNNCIFFCTHETGPDINNWIGLDNKIVKTHMIEISIFFSYMLVFLCLILLGLATVFSTTTASSIQQQW
jgi:hypothetical protein